MYSRLFNENTLQRKLNSFQHVINYRTKVMERVDVKNGIQFASASKTNFTVKFKRFLNILSNTIRKKYVISTQID